MGDGVTATRADRTEANVALAIAQILRDLTGDDRLGVTNDMLLRDLPGWDSIKQIEAIALAEEEFNVDVSIRDFDRIATAGDLAAAIMRAKPS